MFCLLWSTIYSEDDIEGGIIIIKKIFLILFMKMAILLGWRPEKR
jgi:hypothetical protein